MDWLAACTATNKHVTYSPGDDEVARHRPPPLNVCRILFRSWRKQRQNKQDGLLNLICFPLTVCE